MADFQQYPLPNPGLPLGQQAVSPVAQTNPLMALGQGINTGASLGLEAKKYAIQQQLADQQDTQNKIEALKTFGALHQVYSDLPSAQEAILNKAMPIFNDLTNKMGVPSASIDHSQIDFEKDKAPLKEFTTAFGKFSNGELTLPQLMTASTAIHQKYGAKSIPVEAAGQMIQQAMELQGKQQQEKQFQFQQGTTKYEQGSKFIDNFNSDTKDIQKELVEGQTLDKQIDLAKTNPIAYNLVPIKLARAAVGSARINTNELSAATGEQDIEGRFKQISKQASKGTITDANYKFMKQVSGMLINSDSAALETYAQLHAKQGTQINGKPMEENYQTLTGRPFQKEDPKALLRKKLGLP